MDALRKLGSMGRSKGSPKKDVVDSSPRKEVVQEKTLEEKTPASPRINLEEEQEGKEESRSGLTPIRAPISDDIEGEGEGEGEDGDESYGSGESFDSALDRVVASSITSQDPSPVGSFVGPSQVENGASGLTPDQQGALMQLNEMATGKADLNLAFIDGCNEEQFIAKMQGVARKLEIAKKDPSIINIEEALLPVVRARAAVTLRDEEEREGDSAEEKVVDEVNRDGELVEEEDEEEDEDEEEEEEEDEDEEEEEEEKGDEEEERNSGVSLRAMPVAKLTAEDEEQGEEDNEEEDGDDDEVGNVSEENEFEEASGEGTETPEEEEETVPVAIGGTDEGTLPRIIARKSSDDNLNEAETTALSKDLQLELEKLSTRTQEESSAPTAVMEQESEAAPPTAPVEAGEYLVDKEEETTPTDVVKAKEPDLAPPDEESAKELAAPVAGEESGDLLKEEEPSELARGSALSKPDAETVTPSADLVQELENLSASRNESVVRNSPPLKDGDSEAVASNEPEGSDEVAVQKAEGTSLADTVAASQDEAELAAPSADLVSESSRLKEKESEDELAAEEFSLAPEEAEEFSSSPEASGEPSSEKEEEPSLAADAPKASDDTIAEKLADNADERDISQDQEDQVAAKDEVASSVLPEESSKIEVPEGETSPLVAASSVFEQSIEDLNGTIEDSTPTPQNVPELLSGVTVPEEPVEDDPVPEVVTEEEELTNSSSTPNELPKDVTEDRAVVSSPANLYTALKAVDEDTPIQKVEGTEGTVVDDTGVEPEKLSTATEETIDEPRAEDGDSDADVEDEDDENDDEDDDDDEDNEENMDTAKVLAELANAVGKSDPAAGNANKPSLGAAGPSLPQRPTVRKTSGSALESAGRITLRANGAAASQLATSTEESTNGDGSDGNDETREKLQNIRVKFLRLAHRLGQSTQNVVVAQVLYRLGLAEQLRGGRTAGRAGAFSFDRANAIAEEQETTGQDEELDFACTILLLGKTGVGKSATINSIFDERKSGTSAFSPSTKKVQEIIGTVHGIKVRVIDTPGLLPSVTDQQHNERIMGSVKKYIRKSSPDIVLYFDRLDMQSRDYGDLPLLRTITDLFGAAVWFNAIVVLTHASSAPPDGPNGIPLSYEMFVAQRSHVVQQTIRQAAGDMRLMNPVSLVENHPACRTNRTGQRVLPNGQIWKPQLLLLCFASKILAEANSLLKLQDTAIPGRPFGQRPRVPPLPFLLSSLLQSRAQLKMPDEQMGDEDESDEESEEEDSDGDDYDELPPFRPLSKEELEELSKEQKQQYYEELADREKMFQKKQWREELRRRKELKKRAAAMSKEELSQPADEADDEAGKAAAVPVPMPDMALPPSFDSDNPTHRYRYLETANQWLVRPVLETHGWDHDAGYDGFNVEKMFVVLDKIPASVSGQFTKDKKEAQINFEAAASLKHGEGKVTLTGFDVQTIGKDLAYTLRAETRFNNFKRNKTTGGLTFTLLGDTIAAGLKLEDRLIIGKRLKMVVNGGVLTGRGDKAFGGSLEATLRGKEYPLSRTLSTLGLSVMDWHGDLAIGGNLQSQFMVGKTMMVARGNLNNRGAGQISLRASSSEQLQMVLIAVVPIVRSLINNLLGTSQ